MLKCKICGTKFPAIEEKHYIARENGVNGVFMANRKNSYMIALIALSADVK